MSQSVCVYVQKSVQTIGAVCEMFGFFPLGPHTNPKHQYLTTHGWERVLQIAYLVTALIRIPVYYSITCLYSTNMRLTYRNPHPPKKERRKSGGSLETLLSETDSCVLNEWKKSVVAHFLKRSPNIRCKSVINITEKDFLCVCEMGE